MTPTILDNHAQLMETRPSRAGRRRMSGGVAGCVLRSVSGDDGQCSQISRGGASLERPRLAAGEMPIRTYPIWIPYDLRVVLKPQLLMDRGLPYCQGP